MVFSPFVSCREGATTKVKFGIDQLIILREGDFLTLSVGPFLGFQLIRMSCSPLGPEKK